MSPPKRDASEHQSFFTKHVKYKFVKISYKKKQWRPPSKKEERREKKSKPEEQEACQVYLATVSESTKVLEKGM
jgi:hypothetical protein